MNVQPPVARSTNRGRIMLAVLAVLVALIAATLFFDNLRFGVHGRVTDALSGAPLAGVQVTAGQLSAFSDEQGRYDLRRRPGDSQFAVALDGYRPVKTLPLATAWLATNTALDVALQPVALDGSVADAASGQPIDGATVIVGDQVLTTAVDGRFLALRVRRNAPIAVQADGYNERRLVFGGESNLTIALDQNTITMRVLDGRDAAVLSHAAVSYGGQIAPAAGEVFVLRGVKQSAEIAAQADGYLPATAQFTGDPAIAITLTANTVGGIVRDQATGQPLDAVTITMQYGSSQLTTLTSNGSFQLRAVRHGAVISASGPSHATGVITYTGQPSLLLSLRPDTLRGLAYDRFTGKPMAGITVTLQHPDDLRTARSDESGRFTINHVPLNAIISGSAPAHATAAITYTGQMTLELSLRPNTLRGVVSDGKTRQPIAAAEVSVGVVQTKTAADGSYLLTGIADGLPLIVNAPGFERTPFAVGPITTLDVRLHTGDIHATYIPFYLLTIPSRVRAIIDFTSRAGMNAIVVDIKADDGYIAYKSALPLAQEIGAQWPGEMMGLDEVLALARQHGLYTIARVVVFKDNLLAEARPDLAVKDRRTGLAWDDCGNGSTYWADPFRKEVVDYNAGIAEEAARMGFDEVQFDYIRFPPACIDGAPAAAALYAVTPTMETRLAAIEVFLAEVHHRVKPLGVAIAVDTFGWTLYRDDDSYIGQRMENMAKYVDYICPMVYPSTWEEGAIGLDYIPAHPYEIVYQSIAFGVNRLRSFPGVKIRPWLQDFYDYQRKKLPYGVKELDAQRRGAQDAGAAGWMLWNAGGEFTEETAPARP